MSTHLLDRLDVVLGSRASTVSLYKRAQDHDIATDQRFYKTRVELHLA